MVWHEIANLHIGTFVPTVSPENTDFIKLCPVIVGGTHVGKICSGMTLTTSFDGQPEEMKTNFYPGNRKEPDRTFINSILMSTCS